MTKLITLLLVLLTSAGATRCGPPDPEAFDTGGCFSPCVIGLASNHCVCPVVCPAPCVLTLAGDVCISPETGVACQ